MDKFGSVSKEL
jgi:hypothetical protein